MSETSTYCIIVAAGSGSRFGSELPKQFCELAGKPVLMHTIERFRDAMPDIDITLVINAGCMDLWTGLCARHGFTSPRIIAGGSTRWESVKNAVDSIELPHDKKSIIMVHDGARPIVGKELLGRIVTAMKTSRGVIPTVSVNDSLRMLDGDGNSIPVDRALFRAVQTPQAFEGALLKEAYSLPYRDTFTDDASVIASLGYNDITLVEGDPHNIKITLPDDIKVAELYEQASQS